MGFATIVPPERVAQVENEVRHQVRGGMLDRLCDVWFISGW